MLSPSPRMRWVAAPVAVAALFAGFLRLDTFADRFVNDSFVSPAPALSVTAVTDAPVGEFVVEFPVSETWISKNGSFVAFHEDMGSRPSPKHTLERIDNNAGYAPDNCRWATRAEQQVNRRTTPFLIYKNQRKPLSIWAKEFGICPDVLRWRIQQGWAVGRALETPVGKWTKREKQ